MKYTSLASNMIYLYFQMCFLCMKTRFGLFSRGTQCEMCKQVVCSKCFNKVQYTLHYNDGLYYTILFSFL